MRESHCNLRKGNLETLLNLLQDFLIFLAAHERDSKTLGTETTSTTDTMQVGAGIAGQIVVDGQVDALNIDTTSEDISGNADTLLEILELLVAADTIYRVSLLSIRASTCSNVPLFLADAGVDSDGREVAFAQKLIQFVRTSSALDKDNNLVELQIIEQVVQLAVLLLLIQLDVVLLESVQSELCVLVDVMLCRVLHELAADGLDVLSQGSGEHHHLLMRRCGTEYVLDVSAHVLELLA